MPNNNESNRTQINPVKQSTLVVGASGATGHLLVEQLLDRGQAVKVIVRSRNSLPETFRNLDRLSVICDNILDLRDKDMIQHVDGCSAVVSCLGHNMTMKGLFGHPRQLVTGATHRLCQAIKASRPEKPVKYILMNTAGNRNRDLDEPISFAQKSLIALIRVLLPPHADNEKAADYLRTEIGQNDPMIEWAAVRPDSLTDEKMVTGYKIYPSPTRSVLFDAGKTSRINVAHFMAELIADDELWNKWKGHMPVIYNKEL